jgi:HAD superfamily hydrolase (TIGR01509 family)
LRPTCIVFDCDGTLIDSEGLYAHADAAVLNDIGLRISEVTVRSRFTGIDRHSMLEILQHEIGLRWPADIDLRFDLAIDEVVPGRLRPMAHAAETLRTLIANGSRLAVASNSSFRNVSQMLQLCGFQAAFEERIATAEVAGAPKPAPDVYRMAADMLGASSSDCLAIDDSPHGVQAAHTAGMTVVGFSPPGHVHSPQRLRDAGALMVIDSLANLMSLEV